MQMHNEIKTALTRAKLYVQKQYRPNGAYSLQLNSPPTLLSMAFGGLADLMLANDPSLDTVGRVLACRDASGRFVDTVLTRIEIDSTLHPYDYLADQTHYFAVRFLRCASNNCDSVAAPIEFSDQNPVDWINSLNWGDAWLESNRVMFALELLPARCDKRLALLDWLENNWDEKTGYWGTDRGSTLLRGMAGAFHFLGFLLEAGYRLPDAETVLQSTLSLQHGDGSFAPNGGGNTCLDMDAIDILCLYWPVLQGDLRNRVTLALQNAAKACLSLQKPDGGFPESFSAAARSRQVELGTLDPNQLGQTWRGAQIIRYSSWGRMEYDATQSDLWSTMSRVASLLRIVQTFDETNAMGLIPDIPGAGIAQFVQTNKVRL